MSSLGGETYGQQHVVFTCHIHNRSGIWSAKLAPPGDCRGSVYNGRIFGQVRSKGLINLALLVACGVGRTSGKGNGRH